MADWKALEVDGWQSLPNMFLDNYAKLGISDAEAMVVLHILRYQYHDQLPFPKIATIARRMSVAEKTVQIYVRRLREAGLLVTNRRRSSQEYDFTPLIDRLLAAQGQEEAEEGKVLVDETPLKKGGQTPLKRVGQTPPKRGYRRTLEEEHPPKHLAKPEPVGLLPPHLPRETDLGPGRGGLILSPEGSSLGDVLDAALASARSGPAKPPGESSAASLAAVRAEQRRNNRLRRLSERSPDDYTVPDLETIYLESWQEFFGSKGPSFGGKERGLLKKLSDHYGAAACAVTIRATLRDWGTLKIDMNLDSYPSIPLIWGCRATLFGRALARGAQAKVARKWGAHFDESESRPEGREIGWE